MIGPRTERSDTLGTANQDLERVFANAFSVRTRVGFVYPAYKRWAKIRELLRSSRNKQLPEIAQ